MTASPRILIAGAGLAGLACARALRDGGLDVRVLDKGRGPGGRLSTRREGPFAFDHGGQYLTARDPRFAGLMVDWQARGVAAPWTGRIVRLAGGGVAGGGEESPGERYVGTPGMNALVRDLAEGLDVSWGVRVARLDRTADGWHAVAEDGADLGRFGIVVAAVPAPQAAALLAPAPRLAERARAARMEACWSVMAVFDPPPEPGWDAAFVTEGPLSWVARDGSKPGRREPGAWVLHGSRAWSEAHLEERPETVAAMLLRAFGELTGAGAPAFARAHRWRYAIPAVPLAEGHLWDAEAGIGACGDWCREARGEAAWVSGRDLGERILADLHRGIGAAASAGEGARDRHD
ncbi:MAG TPA: FAD-dependent oxidoreductase [Azospirillaceae bacterium]|nr:FAD-dependent oxidoreductase [Azospirillaceae bacterium]